MVASLLLLALFVALAAPASRATLLAAATLETCVDTGGPTLQDCAQRLVVTLTVQNGQNATESVQVYNVKSATTADGRVYDLLDTLEFTLQKSGIELHYPLVYERQFNARPYEITLSQSTNGRVSV